MPPPASDDHPEPQTPFAAGPDELARELFGDLPCIGCRYNLRGLSIRHSCPECGLPVRATILAHVDPHAGELQPVRFPKLTAGGLILWSGSALLGAILVWFIRIGGLGSAYLGYHIDGRPIAVLSVMALGASGIGALVLIRPQRDSPLVDSLLAGGAVVLYAPLIAVHWWILVGADQSMIEPYFRTGGPPAERSLLRIAFGLMLALMIAGLRRNARRLTARSVLIRTGRVDRQTMLAVLIAVLGAAFGDALHLLATTLPEDLADIARLIGTFLVVSASMFVTIGLAGILIDSIRLRPAVAHEVLSIDDLTTLRS